MQGKNVQIRFILTIMILVVFWGINTSALVINQWMAKAVAPQLITMEKKPSGFEVELLGYHLNWQRGLKLVLEANARMDQIVIPKVKDAFQELNSRCKMLFDELTAYWQRIQGKFFFKDD